MTGTTGMTADDERDVDELIRWEVADGVARATINSPDQGNALAGDMRDRLADRFIEASADLHVRVVVLRGTGERHFCTGAALGGPQAAGPPRPEGAPDRVLGEPARLIRTGWQRLVGSILDCEKPVIAAVNGTAAGGGMQLALACDLVVMADTAKFIEVFVRRGIMPDAGGCYLLPRLVGLHRAKELLHAGRRLPGRRGRAHRPGQPGRAGGRARCRRRRAGRQVRRASPPRRSRSPSAW